jgi:S-DNA-T family DNA segregation ATPase FtsK/SpoIIIE
VGALVLAAVATGAGPGGVGIGGAARAAFGAGWPLPVVAMLGGGLYLVWPEPVPLRAADVLGVALAMAGAIGLLALGWDSGGSTGGGVARSLTALVGPWGAAVLLAAALLVGLIVTFRFSPGRLIAGAASALRAGYAERVRVNALVRSRRPGAPQATPGLAAAAARSASPAHVAPPAATVSAAPAPDPWPDADRWDASPDAEGGAVATAARSAAEPSGDAGDEGVAPLLRVVAEPEDDEPQIDWKLPPVSLLDSVTTRRERMADEIRRNVRVIESGLATFGVETKVVGVNPGPAVTQYEVQPAAGVPVKRITALQHDLELALAAAPLRIEAPIPGKSAVGIEVPNRSASLVSVREVVESPAFRSGSHNLALALGNDVSGTPIVGDLTRMPHLLIAGATGQGKSVCINVLIASLLFQATPERLKLILIDPKRVELSSFNGLPHLAVPVIVEPHQAAAALRWSVVEMDRRYRLLSSEGVRNIQAYNEKAQRQEARRLPYIVIVIDELADLMMVAAGEVEELVCRIAQLARAVGIHLVIATQRPSTDIITGLIKANVPSRIAFAVGSQVDSRVILDSGGAEKLLGRGDMLYQPVDAGKPTRLQGAFITDTEVESVTGFWTAQGEPRFIDEVFDAANTVSTEVGESERRLDPLFARAARAVAAEGVASVSLVQRKFNVGYSRAGRIVDQLAEHRVIGGYQGSKSREVLMSLPDVDELLERVGLEG